MDSHIYLPAKPANNTSTSDSSPESNSNSSSYQERSPVASVKHLHLPSEVAANHLRHYLAEAGNNRDDANYHLKNTHESLLKATGYLKAAKDKLQNVDKNLEEVNKLVNNVLSIGDERMDSIKYYKRAYDVSEEEGRKMGETLRERGEELRRQAEEIERLRRALVFESGVDGKHR